MEVHRGEVFYADLSPVVGSEQGGVRPVLIVQNEIGNRHSPTVIAAAITSRLDKARSLIKATYHYVRATFFHDHHDFHHEMSSGLTTALEFLMSAEIAKTFLLQNLESVVPLAATFALRAMMSLMLHWEMQGGHRSGRKKAENDTEAEKND